MNILKNNHSAPAVLLPGILFLHVFSPPELTHFHPSSSPSNPSKPSKP